MAAPFFLRLNYWYSLKDPVVEINVRSTLESIGMPEWILM